MTDIHNIRVRLARAKQRGGDVTLSAEDAAILLRNLDLVPDVTGTGDYAFKHGQDETQAGLQRQFAFEDVKRLVRQSRSESSMIGVPSGMLSLIITHVEGLEHKLGQANQQNHSTQAQRGRELVTRINPRAMHVILYDDADRQPEIVMGGAARARMVFEARSVMFNCHLCVKLESSSRDDPNYTANASVMPLVDAEQLSLLILGKDSDTAPGINWHCARDWKVDDVRRIVRKSLALMGVPHY